MIIDGFLGNRLYSVTLDEDEYALFLKLEELREFAKIPIGVTKYGKAVKKQLKGKKFKKVNLAEYLPKQGGQLVSTKKVMGVSARPAKPGELVETVLRDGTKETAQVAGEGKNWVVSNYGPKAGPERWVMSDATLLKKYLPGKINPKTGEMVHMPKGGPMKATRLNENVEFVAPWGETQRIKKGGVIVHGKGESLDKAYGIGKEEFGNTYRDINYIKGKRYRRSNLK